MAGTPGVAAKVFTALGPAGVNVRAIAQGASERNISVVIDGRRQCAGAARGAFRLLSLAAHGFDRPDRAGTRGRRAARAARDADAAPGARLQARPAGARHRGLEVDAARRPAPSTWRAGAMHYKAGGDPLDLDRFADHVHADHLPHAVIIDCIGQRRGGGALSRTGWRPASTSSRRTRRRTARLTPTTSASRTRGARPGRTISTRRPSARAAGHPDAARPARDGRRDPPHRRHLLRHAGLSVQRLGRQRSRSRRSCATRRRWATPSRIRATTCRAWTWRAS